MRSGEGGIEISATTVAILATATLATTGLVFLLGVYVGKGLVETRVATQPTVVRLPVEEARAEPTPTPGATESFWGQLAEGKKGSGEATDDAPEEAPSRVRIAAPATPVEGAATRPDVEASEASGPAPAPEPEEEPARGPDGGITVQVTAVRDKDAARQLAERLDSRGYESLLVAGIHKGKPLYRVRVGPYPTREDADEAARRLRDDGYGGAFLVTE